MSRTDATIGPTDHGRRMSLFDFEQAEAASGQSFELSRGTVTRIDVPNRRHLAQVNALRRQIHACDAANPGRIHTIAGGGECKIVVAALESERHPDLAIYKTPPPADKDFWATWVPEIVVEVVSPGAEHRDYVEKREEYLAFGSLEYWVLDAQRREMLALRRARGQWTERVVSPSEKYTTRLLPGVEFDCEAVFAAADAVER